jgi:hypothetical protein
MPCLWRNACCSFLHTMLLRASRALPGSAFAIEATLGDMRDGAWWKYLFVGLCLAATPLGEAAGSDVAAAPAASAPVAGCLAAGNGYLRARIRGALNLDINWKNADLECDGSARPDGNGFRLSFAGPMRSGGRRLRMVFGVASAAEGASGRALPTNLTVIFEGEQRLYSTRGEDRCTVDDLRQERVGALGLTIRSYRVIVRGFCTLPATALDRDEHILVTRFDFAGRVNFDNPIPHKGRQDLK